MPSVAAVGSAAGTVTSTDATPLTIVVLGRQPSLFAITYDWMANFGVAKSISDSEPSVAVHPVRGGRSLNSHGWSASSQVQLPLTPSGM